MFVYLFSLLLATSTWPGVWEITAEKMQGGNETYYLVIQDEGTAELYDYQWYPQLVKSVKLGEEKLELNINLEDIVVPTRLEAKLDGNRLSGSITFNFPQYEIRSSFSAAKVSKIPISLPADHLPSTVEGRTVNIVQYLADKAPRGSFDEFMTFWHGDVVPRYFALLHPLRPLGEEDQEKTLKEVFGSLEKLEEQANERMGSESGVDADYTVFVPAAEDREPLTIELYSERKEFPPGYKPCCGDKIFSLKTFRLVSVAP
jgi:hypothetical protein